MSNLKCAAETVLELLEFNHQKLRGLVTPAMHLSDGSCLDYAWEHTCQVWSL